MSLTSTYDAALLREQRELAFQTVPLGWWSYDLIEGKIYWDERVRETFGVTGDEHEFESILTSIHPEDRAHVAGSIAHAVDPVNPRPYQVECRVVRPDGSIRWVLSRGKAHFTEKDGRRQAMTFAGTALDITETKTIQLALQASEERFRFLSDLGERTRISLDPEEVMRVIVSMLGSHLGVNCCAYADVESDGNTFRVREDYTSDGFKSIKGLYRIDDFGHTIRSTLRAGRTLILRNVANELNDEGRDGLLRLSIHATICQPLIKAGQLVAMVAVHENAPRDWTQNDLQLLEVVIERAWATIERARVTRELMRSEANFRRLADAMPQMIFVAEPDGHVSYFNQQWYEYTGIEPGAVGYESWQRTHEPSRLPEIVEKWNHAVQTGTPYEMEYRLRRADGEWRWHLGRALPVRDQTGAIVKWFGTNTDIHDKKLLEERIQELLESERSARLEAERQSRMKDEFLATLSHELRTPLNAIMGWTTLLQRSRSPEDLEKGLEIIARNTRNQTQIIEDLLDLSRIVSGKVRLEVESVDIADILADAIETIRPGAEAKGIHLQSVIDSTVGHTHGDPNRLRQIFWNLLNNAVKFTPKEGRIQIALTRAESHVEIRISDTGIGISADFLPLIFNRFQQADASTTRRFSGLGIGLAIVKQLVELHGGTVTAASPGENQGATFVVSLPRGIIHPTENPGDSSREALDSIGDPTPLTAPSLRNVNVLLVEDSADSREMVRRLLEEHNASITVADSAQAALQLLDQQLPDVIISDIGMPEMDGYALLREIRKRPADRGGNIPAIALTAYARSQDRIAALHAGFQMHIAKPVNPSELLAMVASLAGQSL